MSAASEDYAGPPPAAEAHESTGWWSDFKWTDGGVEVRKTGVFLRVDLNLIHEVALWAVYLGLLGVAIILSRLGARRRPIRIGYTPDNPRPWYLLKGTALWAGMRTAVDPSQADAVFYFDDTTCGVTPDAGASPLFNGRCTDISKSRVAGAFADVFGYPLLLDPLKSVGDIVEKAEKNGVHNGRIIRAPAPPREGNVYQRLVDTSDDRGLVHDLRTLCVGGAPVLVWEKTKPVRKRFAIHNRRARLRDPEDVFSPAERAQIQTFNHRMGLDWGGLDVLRDRHDGRVYIVDVNKTDLGPVIALSWLDKIRSMNRLSKALRQLLDAQGAGAG